MKAAIAIGGWDQAAAMGDRGVSIPGSAWDRGWLNWLGIRDINLSQDIGVHLALSHQPSAKS